MSDITPISMQWQHVVDLPPLSEAENIAQRLVLLAHYGADFTVWGGKRRTRYWDALTERVKACTFAGPTIADWYNDISTRLPTWARNPEQRADLVALLAYPDSRAVVKILRQYSDVLVLRTRVISEVRRTQWDDEPGVEL